MEPGGRRTVAYCRVSTGEQDTTPQLLRIQEWTSRQRQSVLARDLYVDVASGGNPNRPALLRLRSEVAGWRVGTVVATRLDRLARSLIDLNEFYQLCADRKTDVILTEQEFLSLNTRRAADRLLFNILGSFAEFERSLIRERTFDGLRKAWADGKRSGRRRARPFDDAEARRLAIEGSTVNEIARKLGAAPTTVRTALRRNGGSLATPKSGLK
jgi:DNA invertase Pin-like site-specific DNA recombinase